MTLDEGIKHAEEVMIENLERVKSKNASNPIAIYFSECADESRQLAEWLKELKQLREQQPCNDCISRQAAEAIFRNAKKSLYEQSRKGKIEYKEFQIREMMLLNAEQFIHLLPSAEPERKPGRWIEGKKTPGYIEWNCSECGLLVRNSQKPWYKYCPNCGARMEVDNG